jgi:hypothetical protein
MNRFYLQKLSIALGTAILMTTPLDVESVAASSPAPPGLIWETVVNNSDQMPGSNGKTFNSYNQPSVNAYGLVVMRGRSRGGGEGTGGESDHQGHEEGQGGGNGHEGDGSGSGHAGGGNGQGQDKGSTHGIYFRDMGVPESPIVRLLDRTTAVPEPNNLNTTFVETPSFPRIGIWSDIIATRGNHQPVWEYTVDGEQTRSGTTGIYTNPFGPLITGASKLGDIQDFYYFEVPELPGTRFEVFPGSPSVTDDGVLAFKGNYSVPGTLDPMSTIGKTGVFYRRVLSAVRDKNKLKLHGGGAAEPWEQNIQLVANSDTLIPNRGKCRRGTTFGSTAPPSAVDGHMVFVGFDNENYPTCGGIYRAPLAQPPGQLTKLVGLETKVPGQGKATFTQLGEGVSYDGRFLGFWGAWGKETKTIRLYCPEEGNQDRRDFCNNAGNFAPDLGDPDSVCDDPYGPCYQEKEVAVNQGIFVYDTAGKGKLLMVAATNPGSGFDDFVYWNYSGAPPGAGEGESDGEAPRWRSSAFLAVSQRAGATFRVAFLARTGDIDPYTRLYVSPIDGIYLGQMLGRSKLKLMNLIQTGMDGTILDPQAVDPDTNEPLRISSLALERDSLRGSWLVISAGMGNEEAGWAGIYLTMMP